VATMTIAPKKNSTPQRAKPVPKALRATGQPVARVTLAEAVDAVDAALGAG